MTLGLGIDLFEVERLEREVRREGISFLESFLVPAEIEHGRGRRRCAEWWAACFAAKEAVFKALGTGRAGEIAWHDVEVTAGGRGGAELTLRGAAARIASELGVGRVSATLCARRPLASAVVVLHTGNAASSIPEPPHTE